MDETESKKTCELKKDELVNYLFDSKVIKIIPKNPIKVTHSFLAPIRIDIKDLLSIPSSRQYIINFMIECINNNFSEIDSVAGLSPVGIPFTYLVANKMKLPMIYVRNQEIDSIDGRYIVEGIIKENEKIIIVGGEIRTGQRLLDSIEILKKRGAKVIGCIVLANYNIDGVNKKFEELGVKLVSMIDFKDIIKIGLENKYIKESNLQNILDWQKDLHGWLKIERKKINEKIHEMKANIIEVFINLGLVKFHIEKPIKWRKNLFTPVIIDTKKLMSFPAERDYVYKAMLEVFKNNIDLKKIDMIIGEASSGIAPATWLAEELQKPMNYIRDDNEDIYGDEDLIEGKIGHGVEILLVDDTIGTGVGSITSINKITKFGGNVRAVLCIIDYGIPHAKSMFEYEHVNVFSVITLQELINSCEEQGIITEEVKQEIENWISDPYKWSEKIKP